MKKFKKLFLTMNILLFIFLNLSTIYATEPPTITAETGILMDQKSGKILYKKDIDKMMYPASMTKILTALVAVEYINSDEIIFAGPEINEVPIDSSRAGTITGEAIRGDNLIRLLIIPSGNETACIITQNVAEKYSKNKNLSYDEAEKIFIGLMNDKAKSLGATNSNFINPHGYHDENHYSTAKDIALISHAAMENKLIRAVVAEKEFVGNGAGENPDPSWKTQNYDLKTHNLLISGGPNNYSFATGIKTGFTDQAGDCVSASATKDEMELVTVVFNSPDPGRWSDSRILFEYGFQNFSIKTLQTAGQIIGEMSLYNSELGESDVLKVVASKDFQTLLSQDEFNKMKKNIHYDTNLIVNEPISRLKKDDKKNQVPKLKAPISKGQVIGSVTYTVDQQVVFEDSLLSEREVAGRTLWSDISYYFYYAFSFMFSLKGIPVWIGIILLIAGIIFINKKINNRKNKNYYTFRKKY